MQISSSDLLNNSTKESLFSFPLSSQHLIIYIFFLNAAGLSQGQMGQLMSAPHSKKQVFFLKMNAQIVDRKML